MKIKMKTIASDYTKETGLSYVTINTDIGLFTGYSKLNPEDKDIASNFAGCRYAEIRANIKYIKAKIRDIKLQLEPLEKIFNNLNNRKYYNKKNTGMKILEKEIILLQDDLVTLQNNVKSLKKRLQEAINSRPEIVRDMIKKQDNK